MTVDLCGWCDQPTDPLSYQFVGGATRRRFHPPCYAPNRPAILRQAGLCVECAGPAGGAERCHTHEVVQ